MSEPLITMKIKAMEFNAVVSFINSVNLHQLTDEELNFLEFTLEIKRKNVIDEMFRRKETVQDGNLGQRINKLV